MKPSQPIKVILLVASLFAAGGIGRSVGHRRNASSLLNAIEQGDVEAVRERLKAGADPNNGPLVKAAFKSLSPAQTPAETASTAKIVFELIGAGAKFNFRDCLQLAQKAHDDRLKARTRDLVFNAEKTDEPIVVTLTGLEEISGLNEFAVRGGNVRQTTSSGLSAVMVAAAGSPQILETVLHYSPDINTADAGGCTPLLIAARVNSPENVRILLAHGADPRAVRHDPLDPPNLKRRNAITEAISKGIHSTAPDLLGYEWRGSGLSMKKDRAAQERIELETLRLLEAAGCPLETTFSNGRTHLLLACQNGNLTTASYLLAHGSRVNVQDNAGMTPLFEAVLASSAPLVQHLLTQGANPNVTRPGYGSLWKAALRRHNPNVLALLKAGGVKPDPQL